jgi:hypothetical protein
MSHIHWVTRQNKLEIPIDKDEVNKRKIRECDGRAHDPDTMVAPLTPKLLWMEFIYYESTKRMLKTKYICGCRCYERLQSKTKKFTCLSYTELVLELEHIKIETTLTTEMFANVMGECEN